MERMIYMTFAVCIGMVLDFLLGDPRTKYHPICLIGNLIDGFRRILYDNKNQSKVQLVRGCILVLFVCIICFFVPFFLLFLCYRVHPILGMIIESILCWFMLATKSLKKEGEVVQRALQTKGLEAGRGAVAMIVGRDTLNLSEEGVIKATVETIAENASDGCVAPFFYMLLGGASLGCLYKGINTMDSMIGYKNEKYLYFGRCAAKLDDVVNYIPARISAIFMIIAAFLFDFDGKKALEIYRRDRRNHKSPNSAQTESVMAGALQIQLAGDACYFGELYKKPTIGDHIRTVKIEDIKRAGNLLYQTVILAAIILISMKGLLLLCINMEAIISIIPMQ